MAVDVCSEISSLVTSPRISFSYDLNQTDAECRHGSDALLVDFTTDFDFCINNNSFLQETSSADELFSNGKIIPTEIKIANPTTTPSEKETRPSSTTNSKALKDDTKLKKLKEFLYEDEKPIASKSFWQFKRSTSLNCDNRRGKGFIRSLQTLARSNSTGSTPNSKQNTVPKVSTTTQKQQHSQKQPSSSSSSSSSSSNQSLPSFSKYHQIYNSSGKPPLLKKCRSYSSGVRFNPVLNIPSACVSKGTANLFGFGSFFCSGKSKKKKK